MKEKFSREYLVKAPHSAVRAFHHSKEAIKRLSPPLTPMQIHLAEPLGEGSVTKFTLWFGPIPVRWQAEHVKVGKYGFTDVQVSGPFKSWEHDHRYLPATRCTTLVEDHIEYEHHPGVKGLLTRLLFSRFSLKVLFAYRRYAMESHARARSALGESSAVEAGENLAPVWKGMGDE